MSLLNINKKSLIIFALGVAIIVTLLICIFLKFEHDKNVFSSSIQEYPTSYVIINNEDMTVNESNETKEVSKTDNNEQKVITNTNNNENINNNNSSTLPRVTAIRLVNKSDIGVLECNWEGENMLGGFKSAILKASDPIPNSLEFTGYQTELRLYNLQNGYYKCYVQVIQGDLLSEIKVSDTFYYFKTLTILSPVNEILGGIYNPSQKMRGSFMCPGLDSVNDLEILAYIKNNDEGEFKNNYISSGNSWVPYQIWLTDFNISNEYGDVRYERKDVQFLPTLTTNVVVRVVIKSKPENKILWDTGEVSDEVFSFY